MVAFTKLLISAGSQRRSEQCHRLFSDVSTKHIQTDSKFKHPAHNRFECLAHINNYNNILQNISDIYVRRSKKIKLKKKKQGGEYKLKHAPGRWNLQQLKPSVLFLNCVTGWWRIAGAAAVKPVTGWFIVLRYGRVSLLLTHSLSVCFVGLDLFCCTSDGLLFFFFLTVCCPSAGRLEAKMEERYESVNSLKSQWRRLAELSSAQSGCTDLSSSSSEAGESFFFVFF